MKKNFLLIFIAAALSFVAGGLAFTILWPPVNDEGDGSGEEVAVVFNAPSEETPTPLPPLVKVPGTASGSSQYRDNMPSQLNKIEGIAGIVPKSEQTPRPDTSNDWLLEEAKGPVSIDRNLTGTEKGGMIEESSDVFATDESHISMIAVPVKTLLIQSQPEYRKFKTRAKGTYPQVDFSKNMLIVLESDSNLPDKVFEIRSAKEQDGKLAVEYAVNVFGLDKKINTHAVAVVKKTGAPLDLVQVL